METSAPDAASPGPRSARHSFPTGAGRFSAVTCRTSSSFIGKCVLTADRTRPNRRPGRSGSGSGGRCFFKLQPFGIFCTAIPVHASSTLFRLACQSCAPSGIQTDRQGVFRRAVRASRTCRNHSAPDKSSSNGRSCFAPSPAPGDNCDWNHAYGARESLSSVWSRSASASGEHQSLVNATALVSAEICVGAGEMNPRNQIRRRWRRRCGHRDRHGRAQ